MARVASEAADEMEYAVVCRVAVWFFAQNQIMESGIDSADYYGIRAHLLYSHPDILYHVWIKDCISILELRSVVAAIYFAA